jgi:preprotein translocase subunit SecF
MEFFRFKKDIPFMRHALLFNAISILTFILAVFFLATRGLNYGVDFKGGTLIEVSYNHAADLNSIRTIVEDFKLGEVSVLNFGAADTALIRLPAKEGLNSAQISSAILAKLVAADASAKQKRVEFVGPQVGKELFQDGALALLLVTIGIIIYLAIRFEWRFAVSAMFANLHDVIIILGIFAFFRWEFNLPVLAAILAVLGYSVNESVVIADRIRENFRKMRKASVTTVIDNAITATLSRTIITHGSTLIMVLSMLFFGGETLHYFSLALAIGICFGVYSSALVMAALVMWLGVSREDMVKPDATPKNKLEAEKILA